MSQVRDYQVSKCYAWEIQNVAQLGRALVKLENAQAFVNHVWSGEGLQYPPQVVLMNHSDTVGATGSRLEIQVPKEVASWILIHEIAHAMTSNIDGRSVGHRAPWVGVYIKLVCKYLGGDMLTLMHSAMRAGVDFDITAGPIFID
jgi:hypothetical protein